MIATEQPHDFLSLMTTSDESTNEGSELKLSILVSRSAAPLLQVGTSHKIFGWSDFPCQGHDLLPVSSSRSSLSSFDSSRDFLIDDSSDDDSSQEEDSCSDDSDCCSAPVVTIGASSSPRTTMVHHLENVVTKKTCPTTTTGRAAGISFDPVLRVRTYDVILGDHPCCVGGMALQCAWDYEDALLDLELAEQHSSKRRMGQLQLNYTQRRQRLSATTGWTSCQLLQEEFKIRAARQPSLTLRCSSMLLKRAPTLQSLTHPPVASTTTTTTAIVGETLSGFV